MKATLLRLTTSGILALAPACGIPANGDADPGSASFASCSRSDQMRPVRRECFCPEPAEFDGVSEGVEQQLNIARRAVCRYRQLEAALADGYVDSGLPCVPGQGYHYIKNSLVGTTDIRHPSVLMYTADGNLTGPEWIAPQDAFPAPLSIFGQSMHSEDELGLWILHVWVWKLNRNGVFDDVNPTVTCP